MATTLEYTKGLYQWVHNTKGNRYYVLFRGSMRETGIAAQIKEFEDKTCTYKLRVPDHYITENEEGKARTVQEAKDAIDKVIHQVLNEEYDFSDETTV